MLAARTLPKTVTPTSTTHMALVDNAERRKHRRHDLEDQELTVERWDSMRRAGETLGTILDLSAGGIKFRTKAKDIKPESHVRVKLTLPNYAGISPFVDIADGMKPKTDWVGWLLVTRVVTRGNRSEVAGRLVDMNPTDRGMLGLYLSTQPIAA